MNTNGMQLRVIDRYIRSRKTCVGNHHCYARIRDDDSQVGCDVRSGWWSNVRKEAIRCSGAEEEGEVDAVLQFFLLSCCWSEDGL